MSYVINNTHGNIVLTIADGTTDSSTGVTLIGRNYTGYGLFQNDNFIKLLENFADPFPPTMHGALNTLPGMLWYDNENNVINVFDGTNFNVVSGRLAANAAPTAKNIGDQWWDTVNLQLNSWTGSTWQVVGPNFSALQGVTGTIAGTLKDVSGNTHLVANTYVAGNLVSITSKDSTFTTQYPLVNFPSTIVPGITVANTETFNGTVTNSQTVGGIDPVLFARVDQTPTFTKNINVVGNVTLGYANVHFTNNNNLVLHNYATQGNIDFYVNSASGNTKPLSISGVDGLIRVNADPVHPLGVATKEYVDVITDTINAEFVDQYNSIESDITALHQDYLANISAVITSTNANLIAVHTQIDANVTAAVVKEAADVVNLNSNIATIFANLATIASTLSTKAPLASPAFTGTPTAPSVPALTNYLNSISALQYSVALTAPVTVTAGDFLTQVNASTFIVLSNLKVVDSAISSTILVQLVAGTFDTNSTTLLYNGTTLQASHVVSATPTGTQPAFLGLGDSTNSIATTKYVDVTANVTYGDYTAKISNEATARQGAIATAIAPKANIASPAFTGIPTAPTPLTGDNSTAIATTAFVTSQINATKFVYTVSSDPPSGGNNGDFWFQTG